MIRLPDKQIELVTTFADQAVIAIENVRLFDEVQARTRDLSEALEQQTATSAVLQVISSSPGELEPVFTAMLENATRICAAKFGTMFRFDGDAFHPMAMLNTPPPLTDFLRRRGRFVPEPGNGLHQVWKSKKPLHTLDDAASPVPTAPAKLAGAHTYLGVPMLKDDELIGIIVIYRQEVRPFTDKQIELVKNFASQAVIAIENARLLNELRESLQRQTATSEVLQVISSSPSDSGPVFSSILANARRICAAKFAHLLLYDGKLFHAAALEGASAAFLEFWQRGPHALDPETSPRRAVATKQVIHVPDMQQTERFRKPNQQLAALADLAGARSVLVVPMLKDEQVIGTLSIYREVPLPFSEKQIELVSNFAKQAVIAIENARLLKELRESLQQQAATTDVLKVISSSPGELEPVFQAMLENATRICGAKFGVLWLAEENGFRSVAMHGLPPAHVEERQREPVIRPGPEDPLSRLARSKQVVHIADLRTDEAYIKGYRPLRAVVDDGGGRTLLVVPMLKENGLVGAIAIYTQEVRPFADKQIELVQNFAHQAVIAIENARLLNELRESLQQQTATADVLKVISRSTFDLQTVLDTLVELAGHLCRADRVAIRLARDGLYHNVASYGFPTKHVAHMRSSSSRSGSDVDRRPGGACWQIRPYPGRRRRSRADLAAGTRRGKEPHCAGRAAAARREAHRRPGGDAAQR